MGRTSIAAMVSCLALAGACTSFGAASSDGDHDAGPDPDGAADASVDAESDANGDDASVTEAGAQELPCNGFALCDDFESDGRTADLGWALEPLIGKAASFETGPSLSPKRSLVVQVPAQESKQGYLSKALATGTRRVRLAFGMRVAPTAMPVTQLASVRLPLSRYIFVHADNRALQLVEQDALSSPQILARANAGEIGSESWSRYVLDVDLSMKTAALSRDGKEVARITLVRDHARFDETRVGSTYSASGAARTLYYDDVGLLEEP